MQYKHLLLLASAFISAEAAILQRASTDYFDYGELRIAVTNRYKWFWYDTGSRAQLDLALFDPQARGEFRPMGSIAESATSDTVNGKRATILVGLNPDHPQSNSATPALKNPVDWTAIWSDWGSPGKYDASAWRPICPQGYVALGDVAMPNHHVKPQNDRIWCLRQDLAIRGTFKEAPIWTTKGTSFKEAGYFYEVVPASTGLGGSEKLPLYSGTFRVSRQDYIPDVTPWVLSIKVPKDYTKFSAPMPKVTKDDIPHEGELYDEVVEAEVTLPMTALFSSKDRNIVNNMNSPFITISKSIAWTAENVWVNRAGTSFERAEEIEYGYSTEETKAMEHSVGVSTTFSGGIKAVEFSVSLNYQFTHSSSSSYSEFRNYRERKTFTVNPYSATVIFSKRLRIKGTTLDGNVIHQSDTLTGGIHIVGVSLQ